MRWDKNIGGHDCGGKCERGYGWNVYVKDIKTYEKVIDKSPIKIKLVEV